MKKFLVAIALILLIIAATVLYDRGLPVSGNDINMLKEINTDEGIRITYLSDAEGKEIELTGEEAEEFIIELESKEYYQITHSRYKGTFSGEHQLIFAKNGEEHTITIELCGDEKMSLSDEANGKSEYYRIKSE